LLSRVTAPLFGKMFDVANDEPAIGERIGEVINMIKPPSALFEPPLLGMIAKAWLRRLIRGRRSQPEATAMPPLALGAEV
jgi:hypothetical protein